MLLLPILQRTEFAIEQVSHNWQRRRNIMSIDLRFLLILFTATTAFATGDSARSNWKVQIGFAKMDVRPSTSPTVQDDSGMSFGLVGRYAIFDSPDLIGLDLDYGYRYRGISGIKMHQFGVGLTPALHINDYLVPYAPISVGYNNFSPESSGFYFSAGIGLESEWFEDFSTRISYIMTFDELYELNTVGLGTSYWFDNGWGLGLDLDFISGQRSVKGTDVRASLGYSF